MPAPTRTPAPEDHRSPPAAAGPTPRRRSRLPLVAALALLAAGGGVAVALSTAPARPSASATASQTTTGPARAATPGADSGAGGASAGGAGGPTATTAAKPVLADGAYDAFVRKVDVDRRRIVVDLVQVIEGEAAITKALREDGKPQEWAYAGYYVRNQNPLLRTIAVARDVRIHFMAGCEEPNPSGHPALVELREQVASTGSAYYYHFTVRDGAVRQMEQRHSAPAC
jgi:hypothetical protein